MGILDKEKLTSTDRNELHNEEAMEGMFKVTGLTVLYLNQDPQYALKKKMGNCYEADFQKYYAQAQGEDDDTVTITNR